MGEVLLGVCVDPRKLHNDLTSEQLHKHGVTSVCVSNNYFGTDQVGVSTGTDI